MYGAGSVPVGMLIPYTNTHTQYEVGLRVYYLPAVKSLCLSLFGPVSWPDMTYQLSEISVCVSDCLIYTSNTMSLVLLHLAGEVDGSD